MKNYDSDVYLYAKNHYKTSGDVVLDLKCIYSKRNGIDIEHIYINNIIGCLLILVSKHIKDDKGSDGRMFIEFISDISPQNWWKCRTNYNSKDEYDFYLAVIGKCLSVLQLTQVIDNDVELIPLDEKDDKLQEKMLSFKKT